MTALEPAAAACLERTRSAVLNVLVADGTGIAFSGYLLRRPDLGALLRAPEVVRQALLGALMALAVISYAVRRVWAGRSALRDPARRAERFYRGHVLSAIVGALAIPLGLVHGLLIEPDLSGVGPFWVVALTLGVLALPRASQLEGFEAPMREPNGRRA